MSEQYSQQQPVDFNEGESSPARPRISSTQSGYDPYKFINAAAPGQQQPQSGSGTGQIQAEAQRVEQAALERTMYPEQHQQISSSSSSSAGAVPPRVPSKEGDDVNLVSLGTGNRPAGPRELQQPAVHPVETTSSPKAAAVQPAVSAASVPVYPVGQPTTNKPIESNNSRPAVPPKSYDTTNTPSRSSNGNNTTDEYPNPDIVLVYSLPAPDAPREEWTEAEQQYARLKKKIGAAGLFSIARPGGKGRNERLLLIKGSQSVVRAEAQAEKLTDWLNTLKGAASRENPHLPRDFKDQPFYPAERVRHVDTVLQRALVDPKIDNPFPRVKSYFPPHDPAFNSRWLTNWSSLNLQIPDEQLLQVRYHFGDGVAMYFEFLRFYFLSLVVPAFFGLTTWLGGYYFSRLYSLILVIWSVAFLEAWKLRERQLSVRWGTYGVSQQSRVRIGFKHDDFITSAITGEKVPHSPWYKRELRTAASIPIVFAFAAALGLVISTIFAIEVVVNEVYGGPGKSILSFLPIGLFATVVPQVVSLWYNVAKQLTIWENHPTEISHDRSLTLKMFALNGIVSFGALTLTSYVYLPFGAFVVPKIVSSLRRSVSEQTVSKNAFDAPVGFAASSSRLTGTLAALMTTTQLLGLLQETLIPFVQRKIADHRNGGAAASSSAAQGKKTMDGKTVQRATTSKGESGDDWLERIRAEVELKEYSLFSDYAEMAVQFGHVVLFSTAWPLAPVAAFINNFVELRGDAFKLAINSRRPIPQRVDNIGAWIEALGWISYMGALTNASLCYLLRPYTREHPHSTAIEPYVGHSVAANNTVQASIASAVSSSPVTYKVTRIEAAQSDYISVKSLLLGAVLCALASEHGYILLRKVASHLMNKMFWEGSIEEITLRQTSWTLRKDYVESKGGRDFEKEIERLQGRREQDMANFGSDVWKEEDRGIREEMDRKRQ